MQCSASSPAHSSAVQYNAVQCRAVQCNSVRMKPPVPWHPQQGVLSPSYTTVYFTVLCSVLYYVYSRVQNCKLYNVQYELYTIHCTLYTQSAAYGLFTSSCRRQSPGGKFGGRLGRSYRQVSLENWQNKATITQDN